MRILLFPFGNANTFGSLNDDPHAFTGALHALDHRECADFVKIGGGGVSIVRAVGTNGDARQQFFRG